MIQRWEFDAVDDSLIVNESSDGEYVLYTDHLAEIAQMARALRELAFMFPPTRTKRQRIALIEAQSVLADYLEEPKA